MKKRILLLAGYIFFTISADAQIFRAPAEFTRQDTLRGSVTPERAWWDVTYYHLQVEVSPEDSTIEGSNLIQYKVLDAHDVMQIELQEPMEITAITQNGKALDFEREGAVFFIRLKEDQVVGTVNELTVEFGGKPIVAVQPPWDGGLTWTSDSNGNPFIANANQGIGASVWWPNKDHPSDEPDSLLMSVTVPEDLTDVSNGRLVGVDDNGNGTRTWHWKVTSPINNYGVNINIGDYMHFEEVYAGEKGPLDMDYYVLRENAVIARSQFAEAPRTIEALEYWFGPYPFYEDGYKLVEAPYLGMEHQSSVTYGNGYENGYRGTDLSSTGWGMKFDFIIVHETGHEWFANNITYKDVADMWIHESFTHYSETLFLEYHFGEQAANEYIRGVRSRIKNDIPIIGVYNVRMEGSGDMYYKGGNMLHTLRQIVDDDSLWRATLRGLNQEFYHQTVTTEQIESYMAARTGLDLGPFFDQYLRDIRIPVLEYYFKEGNLFYRWSNSVSMFNMPVKVRIDGEELWLRPLNQWQAVSSFGKRLETDPDFYVGSMRLRE